MTGPELIEAGASPRARGNPARAAPVAVDAGCIPACAGEPSPSPCAPPRDAVHPRVRGGTTVRAWQMAPGWGASPRARGNLHATGADADAGGCIPACAGEPLRCLKSKTPRGVHPRVRGGTLTRCEMSDTQVGASPRARGNQSPLPHQSLTRRCIPACAGEPRRACEASPIAWVHPRVRGGTATASPSPSPAWGASPRARGNREINSGLCRKVGCIPACAGEPSRVADRGRRGEVHPRVRGGTSSARNASATGAGASPRARGNRRRSRPGPRGRRCIPACAGEPARSWSGARGRRVHPRVRGGTTRVPAESLASTGASPRARGNPAARRQFQPRFGCIPACAGEPLSVPSR